MYFVDNKYNKLKLAEIFAFEQKCADFSRIFFASQM